MLAMFVFTDNDIKKSHSVDNIIISAGEKITLVCFVLNLYSECSVREESLQPIIYKLF